MFIETRMLIGALGLMIMTTVIAAGAVETRSPTAPTMLAAAR